MDHAAIPPSKGYGARHTFTILSFIGYFHLYALRFNISIAIVAMVNHTDTFSNTNVTEVSECPDPGINKTTKISDQATYDWDEATQGLILSSFFYGYAFTQIPGGFLAEKIGGKRLFGYGILVTALLSLLTPLSANAGPWAVVIVRGMMGLAEGVTIPALSAMQGKWLPRLERTLLSNVANAGAHFGNVICLPIAGYLSYSNVFGGWPSGFYIFGGAAIIWCFFWHFLIFESPAQHTRIAPDEKQYIESTTGVRHLKSYPTPWRAILTSSAMWAIILTAFLQTWGIYVTHTTLPRYMHNIQKFDIAQDGLLMALPNLFNIFASVVGSWFADFLLKKQWLSTVAVRKILNTLGLLPAALCLPFISLAGCDHVAVVALIVFGNGMLGVCGSGIWVNILDIGNNFSGLTMGLANFSANLSGVISPYFVGLMTNNNETMHQWNLIFYVSMAFYLLGILIFVLFAKGSEQPWNRLPHEETDTGDQTYGDGASSDEKRSQPPCYKTLTENM
ncbi:sialin-like [Ylistrum balloti]|uniref:sialin-like n=1 Tax=Ylistrum balloti TaxID=509963 RepID=UPI00290598B4|nr:sialin-like [Ylistrum balloti]